MKKIIILFIMILCLILVGCQDTQPIKHSSPEQEAKGNFTDEMKIPYTVDLDEYGANSIERTGDHVSSPYFSQIDFYNAKNTDTLTILSNFKTQQQTSEWSCGLSAVLMVLEHYGMRGDYNEETLANMRINEMTPEATTLESIVKIFTDIGGFDIDSTYNYEGDEVYEYMTFEMIEQLLSEDKPILIAWNDRGGHWQVIIGYDNMGTKAYNDDVIIVADSYDSTDHNQDGYGVYPAMRFYYNWTMYDYFEDNFDSAERDMLFCVVSPTNSDSYSNPT